MKDLLLSVHIVATTLNLEISRYCVRKYVKESKNSTQVRTAREARLYFLIYPIKSLFSGVVVVFDFVLD